MIDRCCEAFPVRMMCRGLAVSPSGDYGWRARRPSARDRENRRLLARSEVLHAESDGVLGAGRIWEALRFAGETCRVNRVARLLHTRGLKGILQKTRWRKKRAAVRPEGVMTHRARDCRAHASNTRWVTELPFMESVEGWLSLCAVKDLHSDMIVGWSMSDRQTRGLVLHAVLMALWQRQDRAPVIRHSDRGCQFTSGEDPRVLKGQTLTQSMSAVGSCADSASMEGFFGMLKRERVNRRIDQTRGEARADIVDDIERFYNPRCRRRREVAKQQDLLFTQPSVEKG